MASLQCSACGLFVADLAEIVKMYNAEEDVTPTAGWDDSYGRDLTPLFVELKVDLGCCKTHLLTLYEPEV